MFRLAQVPRLPNHAIIAQDYLNVKRFSSVPLSEINNQRTNNYEVILTDQPRRFYIDLDLKSSSTHFPTTLDDLIDQCNETINHILSKEFKLKYQTPIILKTKNETTKKSAHLIYPDLILYNATSTKYLAQVIKHHIEHIPILKEAIDMKVYNNNQCFRLAYNTKINKDDTYQLIPTKQETIEQTLVSSNDPLTILKNLKEKAMEYSQARDGEHIIPLFLASTRVKETRETHPWSYISSYQDSYALQFLSTIPNSSKQPQSYEIWWTIGQALKNIGNTPIYLQAWIDWSNLADKRYPNEHINCTLAWQRMTTSKFGLRLGYLELLSNAHNKERITRDPLKELTETKDADQYESRYARPYDFTRASVSVESTSSESLRASEESPSTPEESPSTSSSYNTIIHQSSMGSGKTYQIMRYIEETKPQKVLIISPRRSFTREKASEFKDIIKNIQDYQEIPSQIDWYTFPNLVIQVESLHHLNSSECTYDLIIADEIESILNQFSSTTHNQLEESFKAFIKILTRSKNSIMADAFITNRTIEFCKSLDLNYKFEVNTFNPNSHITAHILGIARSPTQVPGLKQTFLEHIKDSIKKGKKLCIASSSLKFNKEEICKRINLDINSIIQYDSKEDDSLITNLKNVRETWSDPKIRLIIYTTIITVGVSFDIPNIFDNIYIYGTSNCPIARDLLQSHFRVRHIKDPHIYISLNASTNGSKPSNLNGIYGFQGRLKELLNEYQLDQESIEMEKIYKQLGAYNELEESLGKTRFEDIFMHWLKRVGYKIKKNQEPPKIIKATKVVQETITKEQYETIKKLPYSTIHAYDELQKAGAASKEVKIALEAYFYYKCIDEVSVEAQRASWEYEIYKIYVTDPRTKSHVDNIKEELTSASKFAMQDARWMSVQKKKEHALAFQYVQEVCKILKLKSSIDTETIIGDEELLKFKEYYLANTSVLNKMFQIIFKAKEFKLRQSISVINSIMKEWNGFSIKVVSSNNKTSRNTPNKDYKCKLEAKEIMMEFAKNINRPELLPREEVKYGFTD